MVFLGGPRQVGKTTLALSYLEPPDAKNPAYLNWDILADQKALMKGHLPLYQQYEDTRYLLDWGALQWANYFISGKKVAMLKSWRQAILTIPDEDSERVQQILLSLGALGVQVEDDESRNVPEKDFHPNHQALITATFEHESHIDSRIVDALPEYEIHLQDLKDGDWANEFIKSWRAFSLGDGIWIKPSWDADFKAPENSLVLEIDPGMAFGTGHHETTTLCARATREAVQNGRTRVLDIGTGTGILAMIAAKAGASHIVGTDNDPVACDVARENIAHNKLEVKISDKDPDQLGEQFDLVVANILANPLIELAPQIIQAIAPEGLLLLSGILETQALKVQAAYEAIGLKHVGTEHLGEWVLIRFEI